MNGEDRDDGTGEGGRGGRTGGRRARRIGMRGQRTWRMGMREKVMEDGDEGGGHGE